MSSTPLASPLRWVIGGPRSVGARAALPPDRHWAAPAAQRHANRPREGVRRRLRNTRPSRGARAMSAPSGLGALSTRGTKSSPSSPSYIMWIGIR
jgi:hypothetical protein